MKSSRAAGRLPFFDTSIRTAVFKRMDSLLGGSITVTDSHGTKRLGQGRLQGSLHVHDDRFYKHVALRGAIGAAEAYRDGMWDSDDVTALFRIFAQNIGRESAFERWLISLFSTGQYLAHKARINTLKISRKNIEEHYDLGNDFFKLFLDDTLTYSAAIYEEGYVSQEAASIAKLKRLALKLGVKAGQHVLEIGTGWGSNAIFLAKTYGCKVTTTTISTQQYELAVERVRLEGLEHLVDVRKDDYRILTGKYDRIVSVEMIEAIGHKQLPVFFNKCGNLLKEDGLMAIQVITMNDQGYKRYLKSIDFIRAIVFPGSCCPSRTALLQAASKGSDLRAQHLEEIGIHYAKTLQDWRARLQDNRQEILDLGYSERFLRMWQFYLCYCEAGFLERHIGDVQLVFSKPKWRGEVSVEPIRTAKEVAAL